MESLPDGNDKSVWPTSLLPQLNTQPPEPMVNHRGSVEVFDAFRTIQGEGPYGGFPSVFLRLAGCNLQCPHCDTDYTSRRGILTPPQVMDQISAISKGGLIVITGGEPFRQDITSLVKMMLNMEFVVQIETNGCFYLEKFPYKRVTTICSPKTPSIHPSFQPTAYKYILDADHIDPNDGLPTSVLGMKRPPARPHTQDVEVYVQPMDAKDPTKSTANLEATVKSVFQFGYKLSLQIHKIIGLP